MSTSPGVTYSPATLTTLCALAGSIRAATSAIFPALMATSRIALILFFPSITCPPFSSRSYSCAAADELSIKIRLKQNGAFMAQPFYSNASRFKFPGHGDNVAKRGEARLPCQGSLHLTGVGADAGASGVARAD